MALVVTLKNEFSNNLQGEHTSKCQTLPWVKGFKATVFNSPMGTL